MVLKTRYFPATSSWIQVNLGQTRKVTGIVIQGCPQYDYWITKFKIQHSMDGSAWTDYTADGDVSQESLPPLKQQNYQTFRTVMDHSPILEICKKFACSVIHHNPSVFPYVPVLPGLDGQKHC